MFVCVRVRVCVCVWGGRGARGGRGFRFRANERATNFDKMIGAQRMWNVPVLMASFGMVMLDVATRKSRLQQQYLDGW